ncbi:MAG TPA: hypothetical protein VHG09_00600 [Longimicrobiales bacterium]|nr:hypothetical protein [Longimicrobiales bacterium]
MHGTVFAERSTHLGRLNAGDEVLLIPGPPIDDDPGIWVHMPEGDVIGHLPPEIEYWLAPWMLLGGSARAKAVRVSGADTPSWRRVLLEVELNGSSVTS